MSGSAMPFPNDNPRGVLPMSPIWRESPTRLPSRNTKTLSRAKGRLSGAKATDEARAEAHALISTTQALLGYPLKVCRFYALGSDI